MFLVRRVQSARISILSSVKRIIKKNRTIYTLNVNLQKIRDLYLEIQGETLKFPYVWLRDNCQCEKCFHQSAKSRIIDWRNFNLLVKPIDLVEEEKSVLVTWDDGHKSRYELNWLKLRSFKKSDQRKYDDEIYKPRKITWNGDEFEEICTKHDYSEVMSSDTALYNWLHKLSVYGVALIRNTPSLETALDGIVDKIGFTKQTHYGVKFVVQNVANTSNVAYLSSNLPMHTDLPYYEYCPGVNMLHCLVQTESKGGENLLSDGHYVANYMKKNHPDQHRLLTEVEVEWRDVGTENGNDFHKLYRSPVIVRAKNDEIIRINFSIPQRGSNFPGSIEDVNPWYEAHNLFLLLNHKFSAKFKTESGDILIFDNIRLLHGRNAYEDNAVNVRKLIGAYVDWDEIYSRLRCLKVKLSDNNIAV